MASYSLRGPDGRFISNPNSVSKPRNRRPAKCSCGQCVQKLPGVTRVAFVIDESGSMAHLSGTVNKMYQNQIDSLYDESIKNNQTTLVTLNAFSTRDKLIYINKPLRSIPSYIHRATNLTALCDAICNTVDALSVRMIEKNDAFLVIIFTDGIENASSYQNKQRIQKLLIDKQKEGNWTFVFHVPPGQKQACINLGIPSDNIREWDGTAKGLEEASIATTSSLGNYYRSRASGQSASKSFFTVNLNNINSRVLNQKLNDISTQCRVLNVDKEYKIQDFVEKYIGWYKPGQAFYQLTKDETINPDREILIKEKNKSQIYTGRQARDLIGMSYDKIAKVSVGNMGNYDLFLESRSRNRLLVRGSKLIVKL